MEFDQRGYVIGFSFPGMFHLHNDLAAAVLSFFVFSFAISMRSLIRSMTTSFGSVKPTSS